MATVVFETVRRRADTVTATGTVDGTRVTVMAWFGHLQQLFAAQGATTAAERKAVARQYLAQQLKAAADEVVETDIDVSGGAVTIL